MPAHRLRHVILTCVAALAVVAPAADAAPSSNPNIAPA